MVDLGNTPQGYRSEGGRAMSSSEYQVTGMTCGHCETAIREEVGKIPGVENIQVSAQTGRLVVAGADDVDDARVIEAVEEAGYSAVRAR
jgi:copper chaperone